MRSVALATVLLFAATARGGPWVDPHPGHGYVSISFNSYLADEYFSGPGEVNGATPVPPGTLRPIAVPIKQAGVAFPISERSDFAELGLIVYGEVSVSHGFGLVLSLPAVRGLSQALDGGQSLTNVGVGDLQLGAKYQVPQIKKAPGLAMGPQLILIMPTGDQNGRARFPDALNAPLPEPTGNGTADVDVRWAMGYSFFPLPMFAAAEVGYHHHFNAASCTDPMGNKTSVTFSDDIPWSVQVGATWTPNKRWFHHGTLIAQARGVQSAQNGDVPAMAGSLFLQTCGQSNNQSFVSFGGQLLLFPWKFLGVVYSVEHSLTGVNSGYGLTNIAGIAGQF